MRFQALIRCTRLRFNLTEQHICFIVAPSGATCRANNYMRLLLMLIRIVLLTAIPVFCVYGAEVCRESSGEMPSLECAQIDLVRNDAQLNQYYKKLISALETEPGRKDLLRQSQRAWIAFRDAHCEYDASAFSGGKMESLVDVICRNSMTTTRNKQFKFMLKAFLGL